MNTVYAMSINTPLRDVFDAADRITRIGKLPYSDETVKTLIREMIAMSKAIATVSDRSEKALAARKAGE